MKKNKNKKILFLGLGAIIIVALILVLIFVSSNKENNTSQQGSVEPSNLEDIYATEESNTPQQAYVGLNNLEDIYAKLPDFDRILEKPGITQEQKENAIKNTRTFLSLCGGNGYVGDFITNDFRYQLTCDTGTGPSYYATYVYNDLEYLDYKFSGESSIYDNWREEVILPVLTLGEMENKIYITASHYIQIVFGDIGLPSKPIITSP